MSDTQAKPPVQLVSSRAWRVELVREKRRERRFFWTTASRGAVGHGTNLDRGMVRIRFPTSQYQTNLLYPFIMQILSSRKPKALCIFLFF